MLSTTPGAYTLVALSEHPYDIGGSHRGGHEIVEGQSMSPRERTSRGQYGHAGPFVLRIVAKSEVNVWHSLCRRQARHLTILNGLGLGSALSNVGRKIFGCRYAWAATPCNA